MKLPHINDAVHLIFSVMIVHRWLVLMHLYIFFMAGNLLHRSVPSYYFYYSMKNVCLIFVVLMRCDIFLKSVNFVLCV